MRMTILRWGFRWARNNHLCLDLAYENIFSDLGILRGNDKKDLPESIRLWTFVTHRWGATPPHP